MSIHEPTAARPTHPPCPAPPAGEPPSATHTPLRSQLATTGRVAATVLSGLFAGFFLTYAMSVVIGLSRVDDSTYVTTFQAINATIRNPTFAVVFFATLPVTLAASALARGIDRRLLAAGAALVFATMVITFAFNVPLNDQLATYVELDATSAATARSDFEDAWNRWNLLRTATAVGGAIFIAAARRPGAHRPVR